MPRPLCLRDLLCGGTLDCILRSRIGPCMWDDVHGKGFPFSDLGSGACRMIGLFRLRKTRI